MDSRPPKNSSVQLNNRIEQSYQEVIMKLALILAPLVLVTGMALAQKTTPVTPVAAPTTCSIPAVNVNNASAADIAKVPGLGAKLADLIVKNRPYTDESELVKKVKGIGMKNVLKFRACFLYK